MIFGSKTEDSAELFTDYVSDQVPSSLLQKTLSMGANVVIQASRKFVDLVISRSRPALLINGLLKPETVDELIARRKEYPNVRIEHLALAATNCRETWGQAVLLLEELAQREKEKPKEDWSELRHVRRVFECAQAAEDGPAEVATALAAALQAEGQRFRHPLISRFLLRHAIETGGDVQDYAHDVLFFFPYDTDVLGAALGVLSQDDSKRAVLEQLWNLSHRSPPSE